MWKCFLLNKLWSHPIISNDHWEAGGNYKVSEGHNPGKNSKTAASSEFIIICHYNRICFVNKGIVKLVSTGFMLPLFNQIFSDPKNFLGTTLKFAIETQMTKFPNQMPN